MNGLSKKRSRNIRRLLLVLVLGLTCPRPPAAGALPAGDVRRDAVVEAVARVMPSVVNISTETLVAVRDPFAALLEEFWGPYYRRRPPAAQYSLGSGVIVDEAGYVLTNDHVVRRADRIRVKFATEAGGKEYEAELVASTSRKDVALLRIKAQPGETFSAVKFADDDDLWLGETVVALGNPFGLGGSVSRGILSSKSRRPPVENAPLDVADWLQTDAAINPGNSGGPLINLRGELIGLNVAVYREGQGIGFATPIKRVTEALAEIFSPGLNQLWFGARVRPGGSQLVVSAVEPGSPAERGGLEAGDLIESINGKSPRGFVEFIQELSAAGDRKEVVLGLRRAGARKSAKVRLVQEGTVFNAALIKQRLGLSVQEITRDLQERLGLMTSEGLLVVAVDRNSPAAEAKLQRGHIIVALDQQQPENLVAAAKLLHGRKSGEKVVLEVLVQRQRGAFIIPQRMAVELTVQ